MTDEITIEVNGVELKARRGQMLIEVTDAAGIYIPRFCYHAKLSIAANCRMCLVEMENGRKPMPACATPVADGNKFMTRSPAAIAAQRATMEFLLINHPLDCPICDQGGECELQDLAMGFGSGVSRYAENKRVVKDKNLGPLVSTDMTRCIHCTRCVRFGQEIAGIQELGTLGRGENMEIGTFIERSVDHELSGNIIDLCPVGALNSKPARYSGRAWEMAQLETIAPHDAVGSNVYAHVKNGKVMRVVPRPSEQINETWLSDRDRFSYAGIYSDERLSQPMVKGSEGWREVDWPTAIEAAASKLGGMADKNGLGVLISARATLEEQYLCGQLARELGTANIDHRVRVADFSDQDAEPLFPTLGCRIDELDTQGATLVVGSNVRREAPIIAHRLRKAVLAGGKVMFVNPAGYEYLFPVAQYIDSDGEQLVANMAALLRAAGGSLPTGLGDVSSVAQSDAHAATVAALKEADDALIVLGHLSLRHPHYAAVRALALRLAEATGAKFGVLPEAANSVGACLVGALPHRIAGGDAAPQTGRNAQQMLDGNTKAFVLLGIEPEADCADGDKALAALNAAECVISMTSFVSPAALEYADVLLPIGTFAETAGTFINLEGRWQSFTGVAQPVGAARPAWKVLRVLAERLGFEGFAYDQLDQVTAFLHASFGERRPQAATAGDVTLNGHGQSLAFDDVPMYSTDSLVRRSGPLQQTREGGSV